MRGAQRGIAAAVDGQGLCRGLWQRKLCSVGHHSHTRAQQCPTSWADGSEPHSFCTEGSGEKLGNRSMKNHSTHKACSNEFPRACCGQSGIVMGAVSKSKER